MEIVLLFSGVAVVVLLLVTAWHASVIQSQSEQMDRLKVEMAQWRRLSEMGLESVKSMSEQKEKALRSADDLAKRFREGK